MAKIYSQLEKAQLENTTSDAASMPPGFITYRTDLSVAKVSNGALMKMLIDEDSSQAMANKTLNTSILASPEITGVALLNQATTPANPAAGKNKLYFKSDDLLYQLNSAGIEVAVAASSSIATQRLTATDLVTVHSVGANLETIIRITPASDLVQAASILNNGTFNGQRVTIFNDASAFSLELSSFTNMRLPNVMQLQQYKCLIFTCDNTLSMWEYVGRN